VPGIVGGTRYLDYRTGVWVALEAVV